MSKYPLLYAALSAAAILGGMTLVIETAKAQGAEKLTVVSWGGAYSKSQVEGYHKPFTAKTGVTITNASAGSGGAHNNVQPTFILNYIIFAGV